MHPGRALYAEKAVSGHKLEQNWTARVVVALPAGKGPAPRNPAQAPESAAQVREEAY